METGMRTCQSCGMPMGREEDFGREADGALSKDYCTYCYQNGHSRRPGSRSMRWQRSAQAMSQIYAIPIDKAESHERAAVKQGRKGDYDL